MVREPPTLHRHFSLEYRFCHNSPGFFVVCTANQYRVQLQSTATLQPVTTQGKIELVLIGANNFNETFTLTKYDRRSLSL